MNFQDYTLTSFLGSGSFGVVWEMVGEKASALKVILVDGENEEKQNKRELEISPKLNHTNLVKVFTIERKEVKAPELDALVPKGDRNCHGIIAQLRSKESLDVFCITLELCGENLRKWLKEEHNIALPTTNFKQLGIVHGTVEGLKYLHWKNIIHRDLKPENIMFSKKGYILPVKIGDYGTCRILKDPQTSTLSSWVGTELYRAPETSSNNYGLYSDVFSLGLIMWEVLQLLPFRTLRGHFDRLVIDKKKELINLNPCFQGLTGLIVKMVRRNVRSRHRNLDDINLGACSFGTEFVAADSGELKVILLVCGDGSSVQLLEGLYEGEFVVTKREVTLKGCGEKTILSPSKSVTTVLTVLGEDFNAANLKIDARGGNGVRGIGVEAGNCRLEDLLDFDIPLRRFEGVHFPLNIRGDNCSLSNITINNCDYGIYVKNVKGLLLQSVSFTNMKKSGIDFQHSCGNAQIVNTQIMAGPKPEASQASTTAVYPLRAISVTKCPQGKFELRNVSCSGFDGVEDCGLFIEKNSLSADIQITDCNLGKIINDVEDQYSLD